MGFEAFEDRVVILQDKPKDESTEGGIILAKEIQDKPFTGTVMLVGPGKYNIHTGSLMPVYVKPGDKVLFFRHAGTPFRIGSTEYLIMAQAEVMGKFTDEN